MKRNKKGMEMEMLVYLMIAAIILGLMLWGYIILKGKGIGAIEFVKSLFRFGR
jgi:hypothetical protein